MTPLTLRHMRGADRALQTALRTRRSCRRSPSLQLPTGTKYRR